MILLFKNRESGLPLFVGISDLGVVSLADKLTNFIFIRLEDFEKLLKPYAWNVVKLMLEKFKALKNIDDLKREVIAEVSLSADFVREVSIADYKKFAR